MVTRFRRGQNLYSIYLDYTGNNWNDFLTIVKTPDDENVPEIIKHVKVREISGYTYKINKKSISAAGGARGLFSFIRDCVRSDFMMDNVYKIAEFCFK